MHEDLPNRESQESDFITRTMEEHYGSITQSRQNASRWSGVLPGPEVALGPRLDDAEEKDKSYGPSRSRVFAA